MSFRGSDDPVAPDANPYSVYERLFGEHDAPSEEQIRRLASRQSVFDGVVWRARRQ